MNLSKSAALAAVLSASALCFTPSVSAQNLPGVSLNEAGIPANIKTLFQLAEEAYPELFSVGSGWRGHGNYTYQYYARGNVYAGVANGQVYLLGGPFGSSIIGKGEVSNAISALQRTIAGNGGGQVAPGSRDDDFAGFTAFKTLASLVATFNGITLEYKATAGSVAVESTAQITRVGTELVNGASVDHVRYVLSGTPTGGRAVTYDIWLDSQNRFYKITTDGTDVDQAIVQRVGEGLFGTFVASLAATDNAQLRQVLNGALDNHPGVTTKLTTKKIGSVDAKVLTVRIATTGDYFMEYEVADLGDFAMSLRVEGKVPNSTTLLSISDMQLR